MGADSVQKDMEEIRHRTRKMEQSVEKIESIIASKR